MTELKTLSLDGLTIKLNSLEVVEKQAVTLLLHGWTGDEDSMWVFARHLPGDRPTISVRGLYPSQHPKYGGYSWVANPNGKWSSFTDFGEAVTRVHGLLDSLSTEMDINLSQIRLVGFSQGAALTYAYTLSYPQQVQRLAGLSGFMPVDSEPHAGHGKLAGLPVLMAHGKKDDMVPVEKAYEAQRRLQAAGAQVDLCVSDYGHQLGGDCIEAFRAFMAA